MFIGRYYHTLEEKGRLSLPKSFRLQNKDWIVTRGLDGGLFLYPAKDFAEEVSKLGKRSFTQKKHRDLLRLMANDAFQTIVDQQGRVQLPEYLIEFAQLTKELVVVGSYNRVEIWDRRLYHSYLETLEDKAEAIAESIEIQNE